MQRQLIMETVVRGLRYERVNLHGFWTWNLMQHSPVILGEFQALDGGRVAKSTWRCYVKGPLRGTPNLTKSHRQYCPGFSEICSPVVTQFS